MPKLRSGNCSDIGGREYMEDKHVCIDDLTERFGCSKPLDGGAVSFYGVSYLAPSQDSASGLRVPMLPIHTVEMSSISIG